MGFAVLHPSCGRGARGAGKAHTHTNGVECAGTELRRGRAMKRASTFTAHGCAGRVRHRAV